MAFDPDLYLASLHGPGRFLLFDPDCGTDLVSCVLNMPYDVFVLSDGSPQTPDGRSRFWDALRSGASRDSVRLSLEHSTVRTRVFRFGEKWGFLFFQERGEVVERIARSPFRISGYVGLGRGDGERAGASEFLGRVVSASTGHLDYYTDHHPALEDPERSQAAGHRYFRDSAELDLGGAGRARFVLQNVLYRWDPARTADAKGYCTLHFSRYYTHKAPPYDERKAFYRQNTTATIDGTNRSPLWPLVRFRSERGLGVIAHYLVVPGRPAAGTGHP